eukprot:10589374-Heterocapsa_arctica.AAC.1
MIRSAGSQQHRNGATKRETASHPNCVGFGWIWDSTLGVTVPIPPKLHPAPGWVGRLAPGLLTGWQVLVQ